MKLIIFWFLECRSNSSARRLVSVVRELCYFYLTAVPPIKSELLLLQLSADNEIHAWNI